MSEQRESYDAGPAVPGAAPSHEPSSLQRLRRLIHSAEDALHRRHYLIVASLLKETESVVAELERQR